MKVDGTERAAGIVSAHVGSMRTDDGASDERAEWTELLHALQERAKELNCLYRVEEILGLTEPAPGARLSRP